MKASVHQQASSRFKQGIVVNKIMWVLVIPTPPPPQKKIITPGISVFFQLALVPPGKNLSVKNVVALYF